MFRLTVIYDNKASQDFTGSWGFAALVETNSETLLFDTGWDGILLLEHMKKPELNQAEKLYNNVNIQEHAADHIQDEVLTNEITRGILPPEIREKLFRLVRQSD